MSNQNNGPAIAIGKGNAFQLGGLDLAFLALRGPQRGQERKKNLSQGLGMRYTAEARGSLQGHWVSKTCFPMSG